MKWNAGGEMSDLVGRAYDYVTYVSENSVLGTWIADTYDDEGEMVDECSFEMTSLPALLKAVEDAIEQREAN